MSAVSAPDAIQPIRAWRVWAGSAMGDGTVELRSLTDAARRTRWPVGEALHARCMRGRHPAPSTECSCGIYAHRSRGAALAHARAAPGSIVGEVELWGRVIEHEHGYRSEYARIRALWVPVAPAPCPAEQHNVTEALAKRRSLSAYGVDTGLIHRQSGLSLELADLRAVFVREPPPPPDAVAEAAAGHRLEVAASGSDLRNDDRGLAHLWGGVAPDQRVWLHAAVDRRRCGRRTRGEGIHRSGPGLGDRAGGGRRVLPGRVAGGAVPRCSAASLGTAAAEVEPAAAGVAVVCPHCSRAATGWLFAIARNAAVDALRPRPAASRWEEPDLADDGPGPDERVAAAEQAFRVHAAVDGVPDQEREVIEFTSAASQQSEVAARLEMPLGTVKTRTRRALAHLADRLAAERVMG